MSKKTRKQLILNEWDFKSFVKKKVEEQLNRYLNETVEFSEVGLVEYEWDFDEDDYNEWLEDNDYTDNQYSKFYFIKENVTFSLEYYDNESFHSMGYEDVSYDDLCNYFNESVANQFVDNCMTYGKGRFEMIDLYNGNDVDINNPDSLNSIAVKLLQHGDYYKGCRGFILTNGVVVYTPSEHNTCGVIPNIEGTFHFIALGNIRVLEHGVDIAKEPTLSQRRVLRKVIGSYENEDFYVSLGEDLFGVEYHNPDPTRVLADIDRYFREGIKPMNTFNRYE